MKTHLLPADENKVFVRMKLIPDLKLVNARSHRVKDTSFDRSAPLTTADKMNIVVEGQSSELTIEKFCKSKGIDVKLFERWTEEFINKENKSKSPNVEISRTKDDIFKIVLEGLNGESSVAEICQREGISCKRFRIWSKHFLNTNSQFLNSYLNHSVEKSIDSRVDSINSNALDFISSYVNWQSDKICVVEDSEMCFSKIESSSSNKLICLYKMNDIRFINKHFERINEKLNVGDVAIGCFETLTARKERLRVPRIPILKNIYFGLEFFFTRMAPKMNWTQKLYFNLTKGKGRLLSKAEALGRLVCCGFKIMDYENIDGLTYYVVRKEKSPSYDMNPSYGPVYAMPRLGKNGKIIKVFKLRTMHPYSEYLQEYIVKANGYAASGKPANDFRIPKWGKIMRKVWLDELPQLLNVFKGEMKLVGVRPLSEVRFNEIPTEMKKLRIPHKPGCIPPYISLNRDSDVISLLQAEKDYIEERIKYPKTTDIKYLLLALYNILFKNKRSA